MTTRRIGRVGGTSNARGRPTPWSTSLLLTTSAILLAGCGGGEGAGDNLDKQVVSLETEVPMREPAYQPTVGGILALTEDGDAVAKLEVEEPGGGFFGPDEQDPHLVLARGEDLEGEGAGENIALDRFKEGRAFVPQPDLDHIQSIQTDDLLDIRTFDAGEPASRVALSGARNAIYALSVDGKTVTAVDLSTFDTIAEKRVNGSEGTLIETPPSGEEDVFWLAGPEGVSLHAFGTDPAVEGELPSTPPRWPWTPRTPNGATRARPARVASSPSSPRKVRWGSSRRRTSATRYCTSPPSRVAYTRRRRASSWRSIPRASRPYGPSSSPQRPGRPRAPAPARNLAGSPLARRASSSR